MARVGACRECGARYTAKRATRGFCCGVCRQNWNNRRLLRGAEFYDLFMSMRHDRDHADDQGAWNFMCRMAADYKAKDDSERAGRRSWDTIRNVKDRNTHLTATVVAVDYVAGLPKK